jgi:hypothetical protein
MSGRFQVIVGNVGTVYDGDNFMESRVTAKRYVEMSKAGEGRCADESVTLMEDGEIIAEHEPATAEGESE